MIVSDTIWQPDLSGAGRSKYGALAQSIRDGIADGSLPVGQRLPPVRELAYRVGVTPGTVARAYSVLVDEQLLQAEVGRGTYVAGHPQTDPRPDLLPEWSPEWSDVANLLSPKMPDMGQGAMIREGMERIARTATTEQLLRYPSRDTDLAARIAFRTWMDKAPVGRFTEEDVVLAHGGQSAIVMILQTILRGADPVVLVDALSYSGFRRAADLCRARTVGVPWDDEGPEPEAFEALIREHQAQVFCTSAEVCNPTTLTTSAARRRKLARIARQAGVHILDDDCYRNGPHIGESYRALLPDLGWYVTSLSKSLTAAFRIGFALPPNGWGNALVRTAVSNSFGVSRGTTDLFADLVNDPRMPQVAARIRARINEDIRIAVNHLGGYEVAWREDVSFLWVTLPRGWRAGEFCQAAETAGVILKAADEFSLRDGRITHAVRIAVNGLIPQAQFEQAMATVRVLLDNPPDKITG
ncbi:aminotransferase-like domain-containing protein [Pseudogemmobacter sp. W21_MBD1_M6]|uniref:aminotransferase-like domain-containing protein n=1 Tax=Pseudogemmobacter sp. W21_MBD1_M6 TaxID=3240271 RepID=UPI003F96CCDA